MSASGNASAPKKGAGASRREIDRRGVLSLHSVREDDSENSSKSGKVSEFTRL